MPQTQSLIQQAERHCESQGARFTPIRRRVLEMIATTSGGLKAYELLDRLTQEHAAARGSRPRQVDRKISLNSHKGTLLFQQARPSSIILRRACA